MIQTAKITTLVNPLDESEQLLPRTVKEAVSGIENVDNTADASKPVSTAQQAAIDAAKETAISTAAEDATNKSKAVQDNLTAHEADSVKHVTAAERANWSGKQSALSFDATPTANSTNPVASGGVKTAIDTAKAEAVDTAASDATTKVNAVQTNLNTHDSNTTKHITAAERNTWNGKQAALTFDTTPTAGSTNPVTSGGVRAAIDAQKPLARTATLTSAGWDATALTQTVTVSGVLADEAAQAINWTPAIASQVACYEAGVKCTGQGADSLTFTCDTKPTVNLTIYITIQEVTA